MPMSQHSSSPFPSGAEVESFAFHHSSPLSLRQQPCSSPHAPPATNLAQTHDYNFSGSVYDDSASGVESEDRFSEKEQTQQDDLPDHERRISGCSSISSFPASVSQHLPSSQSQYGSPRTPTRHAGTVPYATRSPTSARKYNSPFRHPSSVKALQMRDEVLSDTQSVLRHHRSSGSPRSSYSHGASHLPHASPSKGSIRPSRGSTNRTDSNLKIEFPLVLLHCTLLPPTLLLSSTPAEDGVVAELLPEEYRKRWLALQDKLVGDIEVRTRGILIPHPEDDYELLEERLLESLDLEVPRIRHNHYFQADSSSADSGFESGSHSGDEIDQECSHDLLCPDCGRPVAAGQVKRKWEVKVFAANGLMRAGAWAAAWREMEKVDVEIRVWLPEELRRALEAKLALIRAPLPEATQLDHSIGFEAQTFQDPREREVYGDSGRQDTLLEFEDFRESGRPEVSAPPVRAVTPSTVELGALMLSYARAIRQDRKAFLIGVLSVLVFFVAWTGRETPGVQHSLRSGLASSQLLGVPTITVTSTSVATSTATVTTSFTTEVPCLATSDDTVWPRVAESTQGQTLGKIALVSEPSIENISVTGLPEMSSLTVGTSSS